MNTSIKLSVKIILMMFLFVQITFAQSFLILMDDGVSYDADAQAYFDATSLSAEYQDRINTFVLMLKDSLTITNLSDRFDIIYLLANEDSVSSKLNLVKRSHDAVAIGTNTFVADQGWTSNGSTGYLNTLYNTTGDKVNFAALDGSVGIYSRTNAQSATFGFGCSSQYMIIQIRNGSDQLQCYYLAGSLNAVTNDNSSGLFILTDAEASLEAYRNGVKMHEGALTSGTTYSSNDIFIGCYNNDGSPTGFTPYQFSFFFIGDGLTATEVVKLNNCIEWYMDDLGTGVQ